MATFTDNNPTTGDGSRLEFRYTFPVIQTEDVKVSLNGVTQATTKYTVDNVSSPTHIDFNNTSIDSSVQESSGAPKTGVRVRVYRETTVGKANGDEDPKAVFAAGSSIRAVDLNDNREQALYAIHELQTRPVETEDIADGAVTTDKIRDLNVTREKIANDAIDGTKIADDVINTEHYAPGSVDTTALANNAVTTDKILDDNVTMAKLGSGALPTDISVNSNNIVDGSIQTVDIGADQITSALIADDQIDSEHYVDGSIDTQHIGNQQVTAGKIENNTITDTQIATGTLDNRYYTETELLTDGVLDARYYTETEAEGLFLRQDSSETISSGDTWSGTDSKVATTAAIDLRIIDLVDDVGGFVPIADELNFPNSNPDVNNPDGYGTIVSIKSIDTSRTPTSGTVSISNGTVGNSTVTITDCGTTVLPAGYGVLVETTPTLNTYRFHRLTPKATEVSTVAANAVNISAAGANVVDINNFADLYQISTSAPTQRADTSNLVVGDLWFDSSSNKVMMVYDGSSGDGFTAVTPNASDLANIAIVSGQITFTEDLGLITEALTTGTGNTTLNTVAGISSDVTAVAGNATDISAVAADATDIGAVAGKATEIGRLGTADAVADMNTLGTTAIVSDMDTLADISSNISTVAGISSNVSTVAGISSAVSTVASNNGNINIVANNNANVTAVGGKATEIGRLGTTDAVADLAILGTADAVADMNTLATTAIVSDMDTLADISSNITTVAGISGNVTTVAGNNANVSAVAGNNLNITAVAGNSSNINAAVSNASNINSAVSNATNINTVAGNNSNISTVAGVSSNVTTVANSISNVNTAASNISSINTAASNISNVNNFTDRYQIASSNPSTDGGGNSLAAGDLYFNTAQNELRVYTGSAWQGGVTATGNLAGLTTNTFTGLQTLNANLTIGGTAPTINFTDTDNNPDYLIQVNNGAWILYDASNGADKIKVQSDGHIDITPNTDFLGGIDVTGNITCTGTVDGVDVAALKTAKDSLSTTNGALVNGVTATTQAQSDNSTKVSTTAYVRTAISNLVDSSPSTLDTLNELAAALGDDANFSTTVTNSIATKAPLASPTFTGTVTAGTITGTNLTLDFGTL